MEFLRVSLLICCQKSHMALLPAEGASRLTRTSYVALSHPPRMVHTFAAHHYLRPTFFRSQVSHSLLVVFLSVRRRVIRRLGGCGLGCALRAVHSDSSFRCFHFNIVCGFETRCGSEVCALDTTIGAILTTSTNGARPHGYPIRVAVPVGMERWTFGNP